MKEKNLKRNLIAGIAICAALGVLMSGCRGTGDSVSQNSTPTVTDSRAEVMNVAGSSVKVADYYIYLIQYIYNYGMTPEQLDPDTVNSIMTMAENDLKAEMVRRQMVEEAGLSASETQLQTIDMMYEAFYATFSEEFLEDYGIEGEDVRSMIERQLDTYLMTMKAIQELENEYTAQLEEEYAQLQFHEIYYALFPTYQIDENGQAVFDDNGNPVPVSDEEMTEQMAKAEEFRTRAVAGIDGNGDAISMEGLVNEYEIAAYSGMQHNAYGGYVEELNGLIDPLAEGEISEVLTTDVGYIIVRMDNTNDEEYKMQLIAQKASQMASSETAQTERMQMWVTEAGVDDIQPDQAILEAIDVQALCSDMISRGIYFDQSNLYQSPVE